MKNKVPWRGSGRKRENVGIDFEALVGESPDSIAVVDVTGRFKYVNPTTERMFGYSIGELRSVQNAATVIFPDPEVRARAVASWTRDITEKIVTPAGVYDARTKDGRDKSCRFQVYHLSNGDVVIYAQDVTGERLVEGPFKTIIDQAPISMAIVSMDGTIEYTNKRALATFGYSPQDIPSMEKWWFLAYPDRKYREEVIATWTGLVDKAVAGNHEIEGREYRVTCKDGSVKTMLIFGVPVAGKVFVMFQDVTLRMEAQETFRNLAEQSPNMIFHQPEREDRLCQHEVRSDDGLHQGGAVFAWFQLHGSRRPGMSRFDCKILQIPHGRQGSAFVRIHDPDEETEEDSGGHKHQAYHVPGQIGDPRHYH